MNEQQNDQQATPAVEVTKVVVSDTTRSLTSLLAADANVVATGTATALAGAYAVKRVLGSKPDVKASGEPRKAQPADGGFLQDE